MRMNCISGFPSKTKLTLFDRIPVRHVRQMASITRQHLRTIITDNRHRHQALRIKVTPQPTARATATMAKRHHRSSNNCSRLTAPPMATMATVTTIMGAAAQGRT